MITESLGPHRCGIVLAGGEGKRLQPLVRRMLGKDLPKQYVSFIGKKSMLEHTFQRVERLLAREHIFAVIARHHLKHAEVRQQTGKRPDGTVVPQPENRETGPGLLLPLMHVLKRYPNATVAVFPSDHFVLQEKLFMEYVRSAFEAVEKFPTKIVFLGVEPTHLEPEYGYIVSDSAESSWSSPIQSIKTFVEKPDAALAEHMISLGGLWNTMVMVFKPRNLLNLIALSAPMLHRSFKRIFRALGTSREARVIEENYRSMQCVNFSKDLLEAFDTHAQLSVVPIKGVFWSDWGSEDRILSVLEDQKYLGEIINEFPLADERDPFEIADVHLEAFR
jgi:mannose-1-phosphate guanylyltransferase